MELFLVEHRLPQTTPEELSLLRAALVEACNRVSANGSRVRYLRSAFLPGRDRLISYFLADSAEAVRSASQIALAPADVIEPAVEMDSENMQSS